MATPVRERVAGSRDRLLPLRQMHLGSPFTPWDARLISTILRGSPPSFAAAGIVWSTSTTSPMSTSSTLAASPMPAPKNRGRASARRSAKILGLSSWRWDATLSTPPTRWGRFPASTSSSAPTAGRARRDGPGGDADGPPVRAVEKIFKVREFEELPALDFEGRTRATLKIQDGCNEFCSFCQIPWARGRNRSRLPEHVEEQVRYLAGEGFKEVVLTGVHLGTYGIDLDPPVSLAGIIRRIHDTPGLERIRISSVDPQRDRRRVYRRRDVSAQGLPAPPYPGPVGRRRHPPAHAAEAQCRRVSPGGRPAPGAHAGARGDDRRHRRVSPRDGRTL